ncbi:MAG: DUF3108 domain-containing protein [Sedimenticola sp.]|nr:DUF3108 domain-containing protein [Sedimenticola sp.]MCW8975810.1 DUF3108 domain-containing protein [Sedimenticola sp.]
MRSLSLTKVTALLLLIASVPATAKQPLKPYTAQYQVSKGSFVIGKAEISLSVNKQGVYNYRGFTTPVGLAAVFRKDEITEQSEGHVVGDKIVPDHYRYHHKKPKKLREISLSFDWKKKRVANQTADSNWSMDIPTGTQDKFSQQLSLMLSLCQGQKLAEFEVADGGLLKTYRYTEVDRELIRTESGEFNAIKMARNKEDKPSRTALWFAPSLNYLPVKISKQEKDGDYVMELVSVTWEEQTD